MAQIDSGTREQLENDIANTTGISFDEFNSLDIYYRLKVLEKIKDYNELHRAIAAYKELLEYQLISWGEPKFSGTSLVDLENKIKKILKEG